MCVRGGGGGKDMEKNCCVADKQASPGEPHDTGLVDTEIGTAKDRELRDHEHTLWKEFQGCRRPCYMCLGARRGARCGATVMKSQRFPGVVLRGTLCCSAEGIITPESHDKRTPRRSTRS